MKKELYEKVYDWDNLVTLFEEFVPELVAMQRDVGEHKVVADLPQKVKEELREIGFSKEGRDPQEVTKQLIQDVYPYRMRTNHPRYFNFIHSAISPYSIFGEFINSIHNPYGGGFSLSGGTSELEDETIKWMGSEIGYDIDTLGGHFVSGGSMANLTAMIVARDTKLEPKVFYKGTVYVSDQTHSSVAKGVHLMGLPRHNVRVVPSTEDFRINMEQLEIMIKEDKENGFKPFLLIGSCGTTNTGAIDPLGELGEIAKKNNLWYHIDGAYGASAILSSHKDLLKGIETSDSLSWDGHKWLFQTYGCAAIICKDKRKLIETFSTRAEYLKDVESSNEDVNFWDMGLELTRPARGMKLWFTLQSVGIDAMRDAIDQGFRVADWIEEEVSKYDNLEIVSPSHMGIINFRFKDDRYTEEQLDDINKNLSKKALEKNYAAFLTTTLKGKIVLRFCSSNSFTTRGEIKNIIDDIQRWIGGIICKIK